MGASSAPVPGSLLSLRTAREPSGPTVSGSLPSHLSSAIVLPWASVSPSPTEDDNMDDSSAYIVGLLQVSNELLHVKDLDGAWHTARTVEFGPLLSFV